MKTSRVNFQSEVVNGKIYAIGGEKNSIEEYDPALDQWTTKAAMSVARSLFQTRVIDGKICIIGGTKSSSVEIFDPQTN